MAPLAVPLSDGAYRRLSEEARHLGVSPSWLAQSHLASALRAFDILDRLASALPTLDIPDRLTLTLPAILDQTVVVELPPDLDRRLTLRARRYGLSRQHLAAALIEETTQVAVAVGVGDDGGWTPGDTM